MVAAVVYMLCSSTSALCAVVLYMKFRSTRTRLLFWSSVCFCGLALNNILLFLDLVVIPSVDLLVIRTVPAVIGLAVLLWGFVWDST